MSFASAGHGTLTAEPAPDPSSAEAAQKKSERLKESADQVLHIVTVEVLLPQGPTHHLQADFALPAVFGGIDR